MALRPTSLFVLRRDALEATYGPEERDAIAALTRPVAPPQTAETIAASPAILRDVEVLISGWGGPRLDRALLSHAPRLRAVFYGAGSVAPIMTPFAWRRGLSVTSAAAANAIPVAEYTVAMIVLALKGVWHLDRQPWACETSPRLDPRRGVYQRCVGLVSIGAVGRAVIERLRPLDVTIAAYDPYVTAREARRLGVTLMPLDDLVARADVVSMHAPLVAETVNLVRGEHLRRLKPWATFINTSRGEVVDEDALIDVASARLDLQFILDVTRRMPLPMDAPLRARPNVLLTPHIAGSCGSECRRMGRVIVDELRRYVAGAPLQGRVDPHAIRRTAHEQSLSMEESLCETTA